MLDRDLVDLSRGENLEIIHKSRKTRRGRNAGSGISIIYNKNRMKLSERCFRRGKYELVCAAGKLVGFQRMVVILGIYIPRKLKINSLRKPWSISTMPSAKRKWTLTTP